jgi:hypothetical protein
MKSHILALTLLFVGAGPALRAADALDAAVQAKVDAKVKIIETWAADPVVLKAVQAHNTSLPPDSAAMTQDKWKALSVLDPFVRAFQKNEAGQFLKFRQDATVSEAFLSGADGLKVAFINKPTSWSHAGKPKHDIPMGGKTWQGPVELDESTGSQQLQVAVPVTEGGKSVGVLVVGLKLSELTH